jgi:hypothetical protein
MKETAVVRLCKKPLLRDLFFASYDKRPMPQTARHQHSHQRKALSDAAPPETGAAMER